MHDQTFDAFSRRTADTVSRRRSLLALGGAALAASLINPAVVTAKGGKGKDRCKAQIGTCRQGVADLCLAVFGQNSALCTELLSPCCRFLQDRGTAKAFTCAVEIIESRQM